MNRKLAAILFAACLCTPLSAAGPELFYSSGRNVTAAAGTYTTGTGSSAAYFIEPGMVIFASEKSSFTVGKKGINLKSGQLYIENFSKQPMIPVKSGKMEIITGGRAFIISAEEKSIEAVKGVTSLKSSSIEASLPEGRKFKNGKIEEADGIAPYQGYIVEADMEGGGAQGPGLSLRDLIRTSHISEITAPGTGSDAEIKIKLKITESGSGYSLTGIASPSDGSQPVMIFSEGALQGPAGMRAAQAAAREITAAVFEIEKRAFLNGREIAVVFDSIDGSLIEKAETVLKSLPGVKKLEKEALYGKKTIFKINTRADGYMTGDMIKGRISGLKPVKTRKNRVVF